MNRFQTEQRGGFSWRLFVLVGITLSIFTVPLHAHPAWWDSGALDASTANANAVVTEGQLKHFTARAVSELNAHLPGGAGLDLTTLTTKWSSDYTAHSGLTSNDYQAMNVGQLKYVANLVWTRLINEGYTGAIPTWIYYNPDSDTQLATLGQLKTVFNFDLSSFSPEITSPSAVTTTTGASFSYTITATNSPTSFTASGYPSGWSINASTGILSGTAGSPGVYNVSISAGNGTTTAYGTVVISIGTSASAPVINSPTSVVATVSTTFAYQITATNSPTYFDASSLPSGLTCDHYSGVISGTLSSTSGTSTITLSATNGSGTGTATLSLIVNPAPSGFGSAPTISGGTTSGTVGTTFSYTVSATSSGTGTTYGATGLPAGLSINSSTGAIGGTPTIAGTFYVVVSVVDSEGAASNILTLTINPVVPVINSPTTATAVAGDNFFYAITATNVPTSYGATYSGGALPGGLVIDTIDGQISGTAPSTTGPYSISLNAANSAGSATPVTLTLTVSTSPAEIVTSPTTASATVGSYFQYFITATGSPTSYGVSGVMPAGLAFNSATGEIYGIPTDPGFYTLGLTADGSASVSLALTVVSPTLKPVITSSPLIYVTSGTSFSYTIDATNSPTSFAATYAGGSLPSGIALSGAVISGTLGTVGTPLINLTATNSNGSGYSTLIIVVESTGSANLVTTKLQAGVSPFLGYKTSSATIESDWSYDSPVLTNLANLTLDGLSVGDPDPDTVVLQRALVGFDLSLLPPDASFTATGGGGSIALNSVSASAHYDSTGSTIDIYQADNPFVPGATSWTQNNVHSTSSWCSLSPLYSSTTSITSSAISGANLQSAFSGGDGLNLMLINSAIEGTPTDPQQFGFFSDESDPTAANRPLLSVTYTTKAPPVIVPSTFYIVHGTSFSYTVSPINGASSYSAPTAPTGSGLSLTTGVISETGGSLGTYSWAISATNANGTGTGTLQFVIGEVPVVTSATQTIVGGAPFSYTVSATNSPTSYSIEGTLPPGLVFNAQTGKIEGIPATGLTGIYYLGIRATNAFGPSSGGTIALIASPLTPLIGNQHIAIPTRTISHTGTPYSFGFSVSGLTGLSIDSTGHITGTPSAAGTYAATVTATYYSGGSSASVPLAILISSESVPVVPTQTIAMMHGGTITGQAVSFSVPNINGASVPATSYTSPSGLATGITFNSSDGTFSVTSSAATGIYTYTVGVSDDAGSGSGQVTIAIYNPATGPGISSSGYGLGQLSDIAVVGQPYSYTFRSINADTSSSISGTLPSGLSFSNASGVGTISGTPTSTTGSPFSITLNTTGSTGTSTATLSLTVEAASAVTSANTATGTVGTSFSYTATATNHPTNFMATNLPPGLSIDETTGVISGTPIAADVVPVTIIATTDYGLTSSQTLTITIAPNSSDKIANFQSGVTPSTSYTVPTTEIIDGSVTSSNAYQNYSGGSYLPVGRDNSNGNERGLLAFDVSSLPPGTVITSASLVLTGSSAHSSGTTSLPIEVHQKNQSFNSSVANWTTDNAYETGIFASYVVSNPSSISGTQTFNGTAAFAQAVQQAFNGSGQMDMTLVAPSIEAGTNTDYVGFAINASDPTQNPKLVVTYTTGAPTSAPVITSPTLATGKISTAFSYTLTATNQPTSFSESGTLPAGLSLSAGVISGTPTAVGSYVITVHAANGVGTGPDQTVTLNIDSTTSADGLSIVGSGNNQVGTEGTFLSNPLTVQATHTGTPLGGTLVTFTASQGGLATTNTGSPTTSKSLTIVTDSSGGTTGDAQVYLKLPPTVLTTTVTATAGTATPISFVETSVATSGQSNDLPILSVVSGEGQRGTTSSALKYIVQAVNAENQPIGSLSLAISITKGTGGVCATSGGTYGSGPISISTDIFGQATIYLKPGGSDGDINTASCVATTGVGQATAYLDAITVTSLTPPTVSPGGNGTTVADGDPSPLTPPAGFDLRIAAESDPNTVDLAWTTSGTTAVNYLIERQISGGGWTSLKTTSSSPTTDGVLAGQRYEYRVTGIDSGGHYSKPSNVVSYYLDPIKDIYYAQWIYDLPYDFHEESSFGSYMHAELGDVIASNLPEESPCHPPDDGHDYSHERAITNAIYELELYPSTNLSLKWNVIFNGSKLYSHETWSGTDSQTSQYFIYPDPGESATATYVVSLDPVMNVMDSNGEAYLDQKEKAGAGAQISVGADAEGKFTVDINSGEFPNATFTISYTSPYLAVYDNGALIFSGQRFNASDTNNFTVQAINEDVPDGSKTNITMTAYDEKGGKIGQDSSLFVLNNPQSQDLSIPIDEASGPRYRKIALNGLPMADEKPQQSGETDQEKEETYVDALTVGLRHSTTDVYLPVSGSDFAISARRDFHSEVWSDRSGLKPHEEPDRPFGKCWSSNLAPNIRIVKNNDPERTQPDQAYVTDETGAVHTFVIWYSGGTTKFFPMPSARNEQQTPNLETLTEDDTTTPARYIFTRKYGATLLYQGVPLDPSHGDLIISNDRIQGSEFSTTSHYARLIKATDRVGNVINYQFQGANTLIPATISVANQPDTKLSIQQMPVSSLSYLSGASAFISASSSTANGIIWIINHFYHPSVLYAYDASQPVSTAPLYSFSLGYNNGGTVMDDTAGKFTIPIVDNGKVYLTGNDFSGGGHQLFVLGLLTGATSAPSAPSNLVAKPTSSSQVTLTWTDNSGEVESGFAVYRSTSPSGPFNSSTQIGQTARDINSYADSGLSATTTYYYQVAAYNSIGYSSNTSTASTTTFGPYTPTGLVAFWNFDEATGTTANDITGNGHNGTITAEADWSGVYIGQGGLYSHGAGVAPGRVYVPDSAALRFTATQSFTLSTWVNAAVVSGTDRAIIAKSRDTGNCYGIWLNSSNHWAFRAETGGVVTDVAAAPIVLANTWYHVAAVQDGTAGTRTLYVNGQAAASGSAAAADGTGELWMGQANSGGGTVINNFQGYLDEVRLYNRALAASEISNLMDPPVMQAVSRQVHGGAGTFDLSMPSNGTVSIEDRRGSTSGSYQLIMTFSDNVSGSTITGTLNTQAGYTGTAVGTVNSVTTSGNTATANLTGVGDKQRLNLHLSNITPGGGTADIPINILIGDFGGNGTVGTGDESTIFGDEGQTLSTSNYRADITCDGSITSADYNICVTNQNNMLPGADNTPPTVTIQSPTSGSTYSTTGTTVTLSGTASDNVGVTSVTWSNNRGGSGVASGTGTWSASGITLQSGDNILTVAAHDQAQNIGTDTLTVTVTGGGAPPVLNSAVSSMTHGSAGTFATTIAVSNTSTPASGNAPVEDRIGNLSLIGTFDKAISSASASLQSGTATVGTPTVAGSTVTVPLTGVGDEQAVVVNLTNVMATDGGVMTAGTMSLRIVVGDYSGNGTCGTSDQSTVNADFGQTVTASNYRADVDASGAIGSADATLETNNLNDHYP